MFLQVSYSDLALWIITIVCIVPIVGLSLFIFIRMLVRQIKNAKAVSKQVPYVEYQAIFGGSDNIIQTSREMDRLTVEVKDVELVDLDYFKNANIGVMIVGNKVKVSSKDIADSFEK